MSCYVMSVGVFGDKVTVKAVIRIVTAHCLHAHMDKSIGMH